MARPKGSKNKKKYAMSPEAYMVRCYANLKDGTHSKVWKEIIEREDDSGKFAEEFKKYKLEAWKKLGTPLMFLAEEVTNMKAYYEMLLMNGKLRPKDFLNYQKVLLEFIKEFNKYTLVSADTKAGVLKALVDEEKEFDVPVVDVPVKKVENETNGDK